MEAAARASSLSFSWAARNSSVLSAWLLAAWAGVFLLSLAPAMLLLPGWRMLAGAT